MALEIGQLVGIGVQVALSWEGQSLPGCGLTISWTRPSNG